MSWWRRPKDAMEDIDFFLAEETADNIARGMTPEEARFAARRKFGNTLLIQEEVRAVWLPRWLDDMAHDLRYACRSYRRSRIFTATVLLMIALGIGINTTVFSLVNAVLLRPLPYPQAERLVAYSDEGKAARFKSGIVVADFEAWRASARSFEALAGYQYQDSILSTPGEAAKVRTVTAAGELWRLAGARPLWGRLFDEAEPPGSIVISHRLFLRFFAGDPEVIGKLVMLGGAPVTVAGVLPPAFRFLFPEEWMALELREPDVFRPAGPLLRGDRRRVAVAGRLRPGVTPAAALAELRKLEASLLAESPDRWFAGIDLMKITPMRENLTGRAAPALIVLQIAGLLVLLIACANIAGLLLARGLARQREVAIRLAIGAGRGRLLRQYLCEGVLLATLGGAAGVLLATLLLAALHKWGAQVLPRLAEAELNGRVLLFTTVLSVLSAVLFCFWPAALLGRRAQGGSLRTQRGAETAASRTVRMSLAGAELAIAVVLAIGAGLMIRSFGVLYTAIPGFEPSRVLMMSLSLTGNEYQQKPRAAAAIGEIESALRSIPGVVKAGVVERQAYLLQRANSAVPHVVDRFDESLVTPEYFDAIGMRLQRGRWIADGDPPSAAVINETMARRVFGTEDPIGKPITQLGRPVQVVGIAADLRYTRKDQAVAPELFRGYRENIGARPTLSIAMRVDGDPASITSAARKRLAEIAPMQAIYGIQTLEAQLADSIAPRRLNLALLLAFSTVSLAMAAIGIYGVVAYSVTQRTHEIGIRRALGAGGWNITASVLRYGMTPALIGIAAGLLGAAAFARWMTSLVYGVQPLDPVTFVAVPLVLLATAAAACLVPAARAVRIEPLTALRIE